MTETQIDRHINGQRQTDRGPSEEKTKRQVPKDKHVLYLTSKEGHEWERTVKSTDEENGEKEEGAVDGRDRVQRRNGGMGGGGWCGGEGVSGWIARKNRVRTKENRKSEPANQTEIAERETEYKGGMVEWGGGGG